LVVDFDSQAGDFAVVGGGGSDLEGFTGVDVVGG